jgi:hypothetical protein
MLAAAQPVDQTPPLTELPSVVVPPAHTVKMPVMGPGVGDTVTVEVIKQPVLKV